MISIDNKIPYIGQVTLYVQGKNGNKVKLSEYNHALPRISEAFAYALYGVDISAYLPTYIDMRIGVDSGFVSKLSHMIIATGKHVVLDQVDGYYYLEMYAMINYQSLNAVTEQGNMYLFLMDATNNDLCRLEMRDDSGNNITASDLSDYISQGKNLIINWKLKLCNVSEDS